MSSSTMSHLLHRDRPSHPDDQAGYDAVLAHGHGTDVHRWLHYLFLPQESGALLAARMLTVAGWQVDLLAAMPEPFPGWQLRVYRDVVIEPVELNRARNLLTRAAAATGGSYDGWDARLVA